MRIAASAVSLNVEDPVASADFAKQDVAEGVEMTTAIETQDWAERYFQVTDPNGVVLQVVTWISGGAGAAL